MIKKLVITFLAVLFIASSFASYNGDGGYGYAVIDAWLAGEPIPDIGDSDAYTGEFIIYTTNSAGIAEARHVFVDGILYTLELSEEGWPIVSTSALPEPSYYEPTAVYPETFASADFGLTEAVPHSEAPMVSEWTRANQPDDTMALTAEGLDGDFAGFVFAGGSGQIGNGLIQRMDGRLAAVTLPDNLPEDDFYLMWPLNENGFGYPVGINQTELWWVGPSLVSTGETFSVFGRNLDLGDGLASAYIEGYGWITNTAANPYKVDFEVPSTLTNGTYTIYAHNGHGVKYGWSDPLTFEVEAPIIWDEDTNNWFDVTDYGAVGDGVTDDTLAVSNAVYTARNTDYATVYFPAGTYLIKWQMFPNSSKLRYLGDGMDLSKVKAASDEFLPTGSYDSMFVIGSNSQIQDIHIVKGDLNTAPVCLKGGSSRITILRSKLSCLSEGPLERTSGDAALWSSGVQYLRIIDSVLISNYSTALSSSDYVTFDNCEFFGTDDCNALVVGQGDHWAMYDSYAGAINPNDPTNSYGWCKGRWIACNGRPYNVYYGDNVSSNMAARWSAPFMYEQPISFTPRTYDDGESGENGIATQTLTFTDLARDVVGNINGYIAETTGVARPTWGKEVLDWNPTNNTVVISGQWKSMYTNLSQYAAFYDIVDQNSGEQFLWEGANVRYTGTVSSATSTTITYEDLSADYSGKTMIIAHGKGMGQSSKITDDDTSGGTITLVTPLRVVPDSTSKCQIGDFVTQVAIYNNIQDGTDHVAQAWEPTATTGVNMYGGGSKIIADGNTYSRMGAGATFWSSFPSDGDDWIQPNVFNETKNCTMRNCQKGIVHVVSTWGRTNNIPPTSLYGFVSRNNVISNSTVAAFSSSAAVVPKNLCVYDSNIVSNNASSFFDGSRSYSSGWIDNHDALLDNQVFVGNNFSGTNAVGRWFQSPLDTTALHNNTWSGFTSNYVGNVTGPVIELPVRTGTTNASPQTLTVYNSGTASTNLIALGQTNSISAEGSSEYTYTATAATNFPVGPYTFYVLASSGDGDEGEGPARNDDFVTTWTTTSDSQTLTIPVSTSYSYDCSVQWEEMDGTILNTTNYSGMGPVMAYTLPTAGQYRCRISGTFPYFRMAYGSMKNYFTTLENIGDLGWQTFQQMFQGCGNATSFIAGDCVTTNVGTFTGMFQYCSSSATYDMASLQTDGANRLSDMFRDLTIAGGIDMSGWNLDSLVYDSTGFVGYIPSSGPGGYDAALAHLRSEHEAGRLRDAVDWGFGTSTFSSNALSDYMYMTNVAGSVLSDGGLE